MLRHKHQWLLWANEIQGISQAGLTYAKDPFDLQRYQRLQQLAAEMVAYQSFDAFEKIQQLFASEKHYLTPKLDVRVAIIQEENILLVKEISDGKWSLPGGWADVNESPAENGIKEVLEETGLQVAITKLFALFDKLKHTHPPELPHAYKAFFLGEIIGGEIKTSIETTQVQFFHKDELPVLSINRVTPAQIALAFTHYQNKTLATDFD
ncbi:NUDIX hydrolase N-terminal domain-containing protein [Candidatus Berkiella aquae]|uniref:NUDIX hydrolase n=1 Tax=Candidatus Berkiella aquae TaxID=295108 RepID=A0A0Q9YDP1_9GAMM|nr:NUDIX hydrolase [Candidatus Berkiella aquae]MCS5709944.1 NUDIX hydrolase [Candidatus Berkiella aquae]